MSIKSVTRPDFSQGKLQVHFWKGEQKETAASVVSCPGKVENDEEPWDLT